MSDILTLALLMVIGAILPIAIAYARRVNDVDMMRFWLWLLLPVIGWIVAMDIALTAPSRASR